MLPDTHCTVLAPRHSVLATRYFALLVLFTHNTACKSSDSWNPLYSLLATRYFVYSFHILTILLASCKLGNSRHPLYSLLPTVYSLLTICLSLLVTRHSLLYSTCFVPSTNSFSIISLLLLSYTRFTYIYYSQNLIYSLLLLKILFDFFSIKSINCSGPTVTQ